MLFFQVHFNLKPEVHVIRTWDYAYRQARIGQWEQIARDRGRFRVRVMRLERTLSPVLSEDHRDKIFMERFENTNEVKMDIKMCDSAM